MNFPRPTPDSPTIDAGSIPGATGTVAEPSTPESGTLETSRRQRGLVLEVLRERKALVGIAIVGFFVIASLIAPLISPYSATAQSCAVYAHPSGSHWLGCDDGGIDMLSQLIQGGRISLIVGFAAALVALVIGGMVGIVSGYFGGWFDTALMRITDYLLVLPDLVLMVVVAAVWGPSLTHVILVIGILEWTSNARLIRAQVISLRQSTYVKRTRSIGASDLRIIWRHVLPHVSPILIATTVLTIADAIYLESGLAFLGLEDPSVTSWGTILENAFARTAVSSGAWWTIVPDGLCLAAVVIGCFLLGQAVEDRLNPRLKVAHLSARSWRLRPRAGQRLRPRAGRGGAL